MAESELHILRAGWTAGSGTRPPAANCAAGSRWGWHRRADGEIVMHPDEAVTGVIAAIFDRFAVCGSVRGTWLWLRDQGLKFPLQPGAYVRGSEIIWTEPTYHAVHNVLTHPAYAGAYTFGRSRQERYAGRTGRCGSAAACCRKTSGRSSSPITTPDSSTGTPTWPTSPNWRTSGRWPSPAPARSAKAARCCRAWPLPHLRPQAGRLLRRRAQGQCRLLLPGICQLVNGRGTRTCASAAWHRRRRRRGIPRRPRAGRAASLPARRPAARARPRHCSGAAPPPGRACPLPGRQGRAPYPAVDPENRLVARGLETDWETALSELADAEAELTRRQTARPEALTPASATRSWPWATTCRPSGSADHHR